MNTGIHSSLSARSKVKKQKTVGTTFKEVLAYLSTKLDWGLALCSSKPAAQNTSREQSLVQKKYWSIDGLSLAPEKFPKI